MIGNHSFYQLSSQSVGRMEHRETLNSNNKAHGNYPLSFTAVFLDYRKIFTFISLNRN